MTQAGVMLSTKQEEDFVWVLCWCADSVGVDMD